MELNFIFIGAAYFALAFILFNASRRHQLDRGNMTAGVIAIVVGLLSTASAGVADKTSRYEQQLQNEKHIEDRLIVILRELETLDLAIDNLIKNSPDLTRALGNTETITIDTNFYALLPVLLSGQTEIMDIHEPYRDLVHSHATTWVPRFVDVGYTILREPASEPVQELLELQKETQSFHDSLKAMLQKQNVFVAN